MNTLHELIPFFMEMLGTVAFAASGAMVGVKNKMDIFGVCVLGVITSVGGGMTRDIIIGVTPPAVFHNSIYVIIATITSCIIFAFAYFKSHILEGKRRIIYDRVMLIMDAVGLGIFTVVGVNTGIENGYLEDTFLLVFLGTITGVGGGLLRDMMAGEAPYIFVKHIYACASIIGAIFCVAIYTGIRDEAASMVISSSVVILIRLLAAYYHWNLPKAEEL